MGMAGIGLAATAFLADMQTKTTAIYRLNLLEAETQFSGRSTGSASRPSVMQTQTTAGSPGTASAKERSGRSFADVDLGDEWVH